ncbi:MAG TPA: substrate-binding domain-containing protein [Pseudonocardiaceae bacterium]|jgi:D-xylose transport system substrate-binding protein|nr:substrate-binding domain-containing protein [Pseudonocardiaceae bacterium]
MRSKTLALLAVSTGLALAVTACGANSSGGSSGSSSSPSASGGSGAKVGVILPDTTSSARYTEFDAPMLTTALKAQGLSPIVDNAQGDDQRFAQLTDSMISQGVKVLVIDPPDPNAGAQAEQKAQAQGIPVIDYDRINLGGSAKYYVSFNNVLVGHLQAQALQTALKDKPGAQVISIEGAPTDNNATQVIQGQNQIATGLYSSGAWVKKGYQQITNWDNQIAGTTFEQLLTANGTKVDGVLVANDGMAGSVITVLQKYNLAGKVPVTGQDASAAGLQAILTGDQYSTVFKPIKQEAQATAELASDLIKGDTAAASKLANQTTYDPTGKRNVASVLLQPVSITKSNVKEVVDQGYVKASDICTGAAAAVCTSLGIS